MFQLYYYPCNASMAPHFVLEELGVDFELVLVDRRSTQQKSQEYLALNPTGRIPTLVDDDLVLFESPAICLHLCEQAPGKLIPAAGTAERALFYQWLTYLNNTVQAELMVYFYPEKHTTDKAGAAAIVLAQEQRITEMFALLDKELCDKSFLVGEQLTICDYFLLMLAIWADEFATPPLSFPHLGRYLRQLTQRPAVIAVADKENIDLQPYR